MEREDTSPTSTREVAEVKFGKAAGAVSGD
jgi:hypothetical protein